MGKLEGKVALVTGSGRNIGRATVLRLAGEGAHVVVNARSNQQEAETVAREARDLGVKATRCAARDGVNATGPDSIRQDRGNEGARFRRPCEVARFPPMAGSVGRTTWALAACGGSR